jgi:hypothetical protein
MLQTVEAIYDPQKGLVFSEKMNITTPIKVLVTFVESSSFFSPIQKAPTLEDLLAGSPKEALVLTDEDREWLNSPAMGKEVL